MTAGGKVTTFTYDGNGALVKKETPWGNTLYPGPHYEVLQSQTIDDFEYQDTPLNHGWRVYDPDGTVSTVSDVTRSGRVLRTTTSEGIGFGIIYPTSGSLNLAYHKMSVWIKDNNDFRLYVRVRATNGIDYYITYLPANGTPYPSGGYAVTPIGTQYQDGTWRELDRDLDADLFAVFGVQVQTVLWFCLRGDTDLDDLTLYDGEVTHSYYHFNGQRIAMRQGDVVQYILSDHLGTTSVVIDAGGNRVGESRHYPYGAERWSSGTLLTEYRFTGQRLVQSLGIYSMGARWYDPALGRWLSADTIMPDLKNPQSLNRYTYVVGNPLKFVDPTGQKEEEACSLSDEECIDDETFWYVETCLENPDDPGCQPTVTPAEAAFWFVVMVGGAELVIGAVEVAGSYVWGVLTAASVDGDPTNEARQTVEWLEGQARKVEHIMQPKHGWDRLVQLSGDRLEDYRAIQPYIQQAVDSGQLRQLGTSPLGPVVQYVIEIHGQSIIVQGIQLASHLFRIGDAWVKTQ